MDTLKRVQFGTLAIIVCTTMCAPASAFQKDKARPKKEKKKKGGYALVEASGETTYKVTASARIKGTLKTPTADGPENVFKLDSTASYEFHERRMTNDLPGAMAMRAVRKYKRAESRTSVGDHKTSSKLDPTLSLIIAEGRAAGVLFYNPKKQLTRESLDLLSSPADPLAIAGMLPTEEVTIGEKWNPDQWVLQMLCDVEAVAKSKLTCKLVSVSRKQARVTFDGEIEGASVGAAAMIKVKGEYVCDLDAGYINRFRVTRTEERSAGTVSPGLDVEVTVTCDRKREKADLPANSTIADEPTEQQLQLVYRAPWGIELKHGREWHVFSDNDRLAVLRMIRDGNLVAQCNVAKIAPVKPGTHTPERQFMADIQHSLGDRVAELKSGGIVQEQPNYLFNAVATGQSDETKMQWSYYLCAAASGQQVSMVYSIAQADVEKVGKVPETVARTISFPATTRISRGK